MTSQPVTPTVANPVRVELDAAHRITSVQITQLPDELRTSETLDAAVRAAVRDRLADELPAPAPERDAQGRRIVKRVVVPPSRPMRELVAEAMARQTPVPTERSRPLPGGERGVSDNECVEVVLDAAGNGGELVADAGWLRNARPDNVAAAITQAYTAAYRERDDR